MRAVVRVIALTSCAIAAAACAGDRSIPISPTRVPASLVILSGDFQSDTIGQTLPQPLVVYVTDEQGQPFGGTTVTFSAGTGYGSAEPASVVTDASGHAQTNWTLGTTLGPQQLLASAGGFAGATFNATGIGKGTVFGTVIDAVALTPISGATVRLTKDGVVVRSGTTTAAGKFQFDTVPGSTYQMDATAAGYATHLAPKVKIAINTGGDLVRADFSLQPTSATQTFSSIAGRVTDEKGLPIAGASVTVSGGAATNGVFRAAITGADGTYSFTGIVLGTVTEFTVSASANSYFRRSKSATVGANQTTTNVDLALRSAAGVTTFFSDGFETVTGWTSTGFWIRTNPSKFKNSAYPTYVKLAPGDASAGFLPPANGGTFSYWYGDSTKGNFLGTQSSSDSPLSGGTSTSKNTGELTSPSFTIPPTAVMATLTFATWFEIESVNPNASGYDVMTVSVKDEATGTLTSLGRLNPFEDPPVADRAALPYTSSGFNRPPIWRPVVLDISGFRGHTVRLVFTFDTVDALYNGFRGWLIDDVRVTDEPFSSTRLGRPGLGPVLGLNRWTPGVQTPRSGAGVVPPVGAALQR